MISNKIVASLATIPSRLSTLPDVIDSIINQVDVLNIYFNGYDNIPCWLAKNTKINCVLSTENIGDKAKFYWADQLEHCYHFILDDDIIYPKDYVYFMIYRINVEEAIALSAHGAIVTKLPMTNYFKQRKLLRFNRQVNFDMEVNILGTGTLLYCTDDLKIKMSDFEIDNMADLWFSMLCSVQGVKKIVVEHSANWIKSLDQYKGIYQQCHRNPTQITNIINAFSKWEKLC